MLKINKIFEEITNTNPDWESLKNTLTIINGNVKLCHYSANKIVDDEIKLGQSQNPWSSGEYQAWGRSRIFFYTNPGGIAKDRGVPTNYLYICYIPLNEIYPLHLNPNNYKSEPDKHRMESIYQQASEDGYTAFIYGLDGDINNPIVISFKNVKISEKYEIRGGGYYPMDKQADELVIGKYIDQTGGYLVKQKDDEVQTLTNCYLEDEDGKKKRLEVYQYKNIELFDDVPERYKKEKLEHS